MFSYLHQPKGFYKRLFLLLLLFDFFLLSFSAATTGFQ